MVACVTDATMVCAAQRAEVLLPSWAMIHPEAASFVPSSIHAVPALPDEATSSARAGSSLEVIKQTDENMARGPDGDIGTHTVIIIRLNYAGREIASWKGSLRHDCDGDLIEAHGTTDYELATDRSTLTLVRADGQRRTMPLNIEERV